MGLTFLLFSNIQLLFSFTSTMSLWNRYALTLFLMSIFFRTGTATTHPCYDRYKIRGAPGSRRMKLRGGFFVKRTFKKKGSRRIEEFFIKQDLLMDDREYNHVFKKTFLEDGNYFYVRKKKF